MRRGIIHEAKVFASTEGVAVRRAYFGRVLTNRPRGEVGTGGYSKMSTLEANGMILDEPIIFSGFFKDLVISYASRQDAAIEIGTGASSTPLLASLCAVGSLTFYTVDVSRARVAWAKQLLRGKNRMFVICARGEDFLRAFPGRVAFAYLDSYNWVDPDGEDAHKYPRRCTKRESELVHLEQAMELANKLPPDGLVLFDDTWFLERVPPGNGCLRNKVDFRRASNLEILEKYEVFGKGTLAVPFLLCSGFEIVAVSERPHRARWLG